MSDKKFSVEDEIGNISSMYTNTDLIKLAVELEQEKPNDDTINNIIGYKNNLNELIRNDEGIVMKDEIILKYLKDEIEKNKETKEIIDHIKEDHTYKQVIEVCYHKPDFTFPGKLYGRKKKYEQLDDIQKAAVNVYNNRRIINLYFPNANAIMKAPYIVNPEKTVKVKNFKYADFGEEYEFEISIDEKDDFEYRQALYKVMGYLAKQMNKGNNIDSILSDKNSVNVVEKIQNMNNNYKKHEDSLNQLWSNTVGDNKKTKKENKKTDKYILYTVEELKRIFVDSNTVGQHKQKFNNSKLYKTTVLGARIVADFARAAVHAGNKTRKQKRNGKKVKNTRKKKYKKKRTRRVRKK